MSRMSSARQKSSWRKSDKSVYPITDSYLILSSQGGKKDVCAARARAAMLFEQTWGPICEADAEEEILGDIFDSIFETTRPGPTDPDRIPLPTAPFPNHPNPHEQTKLRARNHFLLISWEKKNCSIVQNVVRAR